MVAAKIHKPKTAKRYQAGKASRWVRTAADEHALSTGHYFDERAADYAINFFPRVLAHSRNSPTTNAGDPFELIQWQRDELIGPLFGWKRPDGRNRFRYTYVELPKKNGKSTLASGVALLKAIGEGEPAAEVYNAASDGGQAMIVHGECVAMVKSSPVLKRLIEAKTLVINGTTKRIWYSKNNSIILPWSKKVESKEGWNPHAIIVDELHVWKGRGVWDAIQGAFAARENPLLFVITTAGDDLQSVCHEEYTYAKGVIKGTQINDEFLGLIYEAGPKDDVTKESTWAKANPSLNITIRLDDFRGDFIKAKATPAALAAWKRRRLNIWSTGVNPWLPMEKWDANKRDYLAEHLRGRRCHAGLDLARARDTSSLQFAFDDLDDPEAAQLLSFFFIPRKQAEEMQKLQIASFLEWEQLGFVIVTDGEVCDYAAVRKVFRECHAMFDIQGLAYDSWNAEDCTQQMCDGIVVDGKTIEEGTGVPRFKFNQSVSAFTGPAKEWERLVLCGKLYHNGNPCMDWQMGNTRVKTDPNGNIRPVKPPNEDKRKIDGPVAGIMALSLKMGPPAENNQSMYETMDIGVA